MSEHTNKIKIGLPDFVMGFVMFSSLEPRSSGTTLQNGTHTVGCWFKN